MAKMQLGERGERTTLGGWWLVHGRWLSLGLVLLGAMAGLVQDTVAQVDSRTIEVQVNLPYALQFGLGSYDVGGLAVHVFRVPVPQTLALRPEEAAWRLGLTGSLGYGHAAFETRVLGPKLTVSQDFGFVLPQAELQIPLGRGWTVTPYVAAGLGRTFGGSVQPAGHGHVDEGFVALYAAGISNLVEVSVQDVLLSFGTKLAGAGDALIGQSGSEGYGTLQNGLEVRHPIGWRVQGLVPDVGVSFLHYFFFPSAKFSLPGQGPLEVAHQFEFGGQCRLRQADEAVDLREPADRCQLPLQGRPDRH